MVQARPNLPDAVGGIVWYGAGAAHSTVYVPILTGMLSSPDCLLWGWQGVYNLSTSYWAHRTVINLAQVKFSYMIEDIRKLQTSLESDSWALVSALSAKYRHSAALDSAALQQITEVFSANAERARSAFTELFHSLMFKYADGWINSWAGGTFRAERTGYPAWWLDEVGYANGPPPIAEQTPAKKALASFADEKRRSDAVAAKVAALMAQSESATAAKPTSSPVTTNRCPGGAGLRTCVSACAAGKVAEHRSCTENCLQHC